MERLSLSQIEHLGFHYLGEHDLLEKGWTFKIDNAKRRLGQCSYRKKTISLTKHFCENYLKKEDIIDTILHEIAHALVGAGHGHDYIWKMKALEIGCNGERCGDDKIDKKNIKFKWTGTCPNGHQFNRHKLTKRSRGGSCPHCSDRFDPKYKFNWVKNY